MNKARSRRRYVFRMVASGLAFFLLFGWVILVVPLRRALSHHPILYRYQLYRRMHAVPDVVFIGHSRTAVAVDPSFVDSVLTEAVGRPVRSFNFGSANGNAVRYRLVVDKLLQRPKRPALVVFGTSPAEVTGSDMCRFAEEVTIGVTPGRLTHLWGEFTEWPLRRNLILSSLIPGRDRWESLQVYWVSLRNGRPLLPAGLKLHDNGWIQYADYPPEKRLARLTRDRKGIREARAQGLLRPACRAYENALARLRDAGIATALYEHPFPPSLRDIHRSGIYDEYHEWLVCTARRFGAVLLPSVFSEAADDDFIDGAHIAPWAVARYSTRLAERIADGCFRTDELRGLRQDAFATAAQEVPVP